MLEVYRSLFNLLLFLILVLKTVCLLFSDNKLSKSSKYEIVTDDTKIAETFNTFYSNTIKTINIENKKAITCNTGNERDAILQAIKKQSMYCKDRKFRKKSRGNFFPKYRLRIYRKSNKRLRLIKSAKQNDVTIKILKTNADFFPLL